MAVNPYKADVSRFGVAFTQFLITWNSLEDAARELLMSTSDSQTAIRAVVLNLNSLAVQEGLRTMADFYTRLAKGGGDTFGPLGENIAHFEKGMDRLRAYRNFYVHSIRGMGKSPHDPNRFHGVIFASEAKGKFSSIMHDVSTEEILSLVRSNLDFTKYAQQIMKASSRPGKNALLGREPRLKIGSLERPDWPQSLAKDRRYAGQPMSL